MFRKLVIELPDTISIEEAQKIATSMVDILHANTRYIKTDTCYGLVMQDYYLETSEGRKLIEL